MKKNARTKANKSEAHSAMARSGAGGRQIAEARTRKMQMRRQLNTQSGRGGSAVRADDALN